VRQWRRQLGEIGESFGERLEIAEEVADEAVGEIAAQVRVLAHEITKLNSWS